MTASTLSYSSGTFGTYGGVSRTGIESSLILNRVTSGLNSSYGITTVVDSARLNLELKRHERKRALARYGDFKFNEETEPKEHTPIEKTRATEVKDKMGKVIYKRGENEVDRYSRDLDQWIKKMKCSGATGIRLDTFKDIKVGVLSDDVANGAPSIEPFPRLYAEEGYKYRGGKDKFGKFKGKASLEFENNDLISGFFVDGMRHGECRIETFRNKLRVIIGSYEKDKLNGKAKVIYNDDTSIEGYFKQGVLHGFCRKFDEKGRLVFIGNYKNGRPFGVCWKVIKFGGCVVGRVDSEGELSGVRIAYLYPDFRTALVGTFSDGIMEFAQAATLKAVIDDRGVKVPLFSEPEGMIIKREVATYDFMGSNPLLRDPYETRICEARRSHVEGGGEGLFAKIKIETGTVIAFYNGKRIKPRSWEDQDHPDWDVNAYKIFDPSRKNGTIDIPMSYRDLTVYCASLAHKTNHSFLPNAEFVTFDHPRWGLVPCLTCTHDIEAGEEIFVHYGYELANCPDWYEEAWFSGKYPIPDSMRDCYADPSRVMPKDDEQPGDNGEEPEKNEE